MPRKNQPLEPVYLGPTYQCPVCEVQQICPDEKSLAKFRKHVVIPIDTRILPEGFLYLDAVRRGDPDYGIIIANKGFQRGDHSYSFEVMIYSQETRARGGQIEIHESSQWPRTYARVLKDFKESKSRFLTKEEFDRVRESLLSNPLTFPVRRLNGKFVRKVRSLERELQQ